MHEVRVYNSIGKLIRVVTAKDLERRSKAFIDSVFSVRDKNKVRKFKCDVVESADAVSHAPATANDRFDLG